MEQIRYYFITVLTKIYETTKSYNNMINYLIINFNNYKYEKYEYAKLIVVSLRKSFSYSNYILQDCWLGILSYVDTQYDKMVPII